MLYQRPSFRTLFLPTWRVEASTNPFSYLITFTINLLSITCKDAQPISEVDTRKVASEVRANLLQQVAGQLGKVASLALNQVDVGKQLLPVHFVGKVG